MRPVRVHQPGEPAEPEPPEKLLAVADQIRDPLVIQTGVTTTKDGQWALYVTVPATSTVPIPTVEEQAAGFPVVYEAEPKEPPRAGPAYPAEERGRRRKEKGEG